MGVELTTRLTRLVLSSLLLCLMGTFGRTLLGGRLFERDAEDDKEEEEDDDDDPADEGDGGDFLAAEEDGRSVPYLTLLASSGKA